MGGGEGEWVHQISVSSAALPKPQSLAAIGFRGPLFLSSINFILADTMLMLPNCPWQSAPRPVANNYYTFIKTLCCRPHKIIV